MKALWQSRMWMGALTGLMLVALGGCNGAQHVRDERDQLFRQNQELQQAYTQARAAQAAAERENQALAAEVARLQQEVMRLKMESRSAAVQPGPGPAAASNTGFEAISGVEAIQGAGTVTVRVSGDVLFRSGQATLSSAAQSTLSRIANTLQSRYAGKQIRVEGHSDSDPIRKSKWRDNYELSTARAEAVRDYLAQQGVPRGNMQVIGRGPDDPVASNSTQAGKARNRRVEIIVVTR